MKEELLNKIAARRLVSGVVGLGYVGLALAAEKAKAGFRTIGYDVQPNKTRMVNAGENYVGDVVDGDLRQLVSSGMLRATDDLSELRAADCIAICVPTPLDDCRQPDLHYLRESAAAVARLLHRGSVVVLESTSYPGTTQELLLPILEEGSGLRCGVDFYLGFSPERVDPGNRRYHTKNTPKVVSGVGTDALEVISALYGAVLSGAVREVSSPAAAEMEKLLENCYRSVNIALVNELAMLCERMGLDVWEVIDAAATKPYGFSPFYPGPGPGGHCIPLDPCYLSWKARQFGVSTGVIDAACAVNDRMPEYCAGRAARLLGGMRLSVCGARILLLGIAYKQDIGDCRESAALRVASLLQGEGAAVYFFDPYVDADAKFPGLHRLTRLDETLVSSFDLVMVTAAHSGVDYPMVCKSANMVFDTKNALRDITPRDNIEVL